VLRTFSRITPSAKKVDFIHSNKTAELIAASLSIGAVLSDGKDDNREKMYQIGKKVGLAFQIIDDLIDLEGDTEIVGKALRKDEQKGKITFPAVYGVRESKNKAQELVQEAVKNLREYSNTANLEFIFNKILTRIN